MTSTFRILQAAIVEIATTCEKINDPRLRDRAFDVLVAEARQGGTEVPYDRGGTYSGTSYLDSMPIGAGTTTVGTPGTTFDPSSTRIDNGVRS